MREEKGGFSKTYKTLVFLNFLAVAIFPSLFLNSLVMLNLSQTFASFSPWSLLQAGGRFLWQRLFYSLSLWREGIPRDSCCSGLAGSGAEIRMGWKVLTWSGSPRECRHLGSNWAWGRGQESCPVLGAGLPWCASQSPGCPGWMYSEFLGGDTSVCVLASVPWERRGQSQARLGGIYSIAFSPAQVLLCWPCPGWAPKWSLRRAALAPPSVVSVGQDTESRRPTLPLPCSALLGKSLDLLFLGFLVF